MKHRIALWILLCSLASIATAMSFNFPADMIHYGDKEHAKSLGVSVAEMKKLRKVTGQLSSDIFQKRELLNANDIEYLLKTASRVDSFGVEATFPLVLLKGTKFEPEAIHIAIRGSTSKNEHKAYAAIGILKYYGDPRWQTFAEVYPWQFKEYMQSIFEVR